MAIVTRTLSSAEDLRLEVNRYLARGYTVAHITEIQATLSKRKTFNWVLAIICLFIPVVGWIALILMLMAAARGAEVVELKVGGQRPLPV